jgi:hypothetical protein
MKISRDTAVGLACGVLLTLGFQSLTVFVNAAQEHHFYVITLLDGFNSLVILLVVFALGRKPLALRLLSYSLIYLAWVLCS